MEVIDQITPEKKMVFVNSIFPITMDHINNLKKKGIKEITVQQVHDSLVTGKEEVLSETKVDINKNLICNSAHDTLAMTT